MFYIRTLLWNYITDTQNHYDKKARRYALAVQGIFGIKVDTTTTERWSDVIRLSRAIDSYLDEGARDGLHERTAVTRALLSSPAEIADQFPSLSPTELGKDGYSRLQTLGNTILDLNQAIKTTDSLAQYASLRRMEGRYYAHLITDISTPETTVQPNYNRFKHWLIKTGEVTTLGNSFIDIRKDYQHGEIAVVPDHLSRPKLLGHIVRSLLQTVPVSRPPDQGMSDVPG